MTALESLALTHLTRWHYDRQALRHRGPDLLRNGWVERKQRDLDARHARVLDFEKALDTVPFTDRAALFFVYSDHLPLHRAAKLLHTTPQMAAFHAQQGLARLTDTLDRLSLL